MLPGSLSKSAGEARHVEDCPVEVFEVDLKSGSSAVTPSVRSMRRKRRWSHFHGRRREGTGYTYTIGTGGSAVALIR
jgi:hypothetical protein